MSASAVSPQLGEIRVLRDQGRVIQRVLRINTEGLTQQDSLAPPMPAGNCLNWIVGHMLETFDGVLPVVEQAPVLGRQTLERYKRGSTALINAGDALPIEKLLAACDEAANRMDQGLATLTQHQLDAPAPFSPSNNPKETVRSLLTVVMLHQAYHVGQTGVLWRIAGKEGKIR
ncbi:MAG TPA: DinB family protein [Acidobacteriaceae bacterium]|nr:DinB family protein [Acidobacteriaceae bacterium]